MKLQPHFSAQQLEHMVLTAMTTLFKTMLSTSIELQDGFYETDTSLNTEMLLTEIDYPVIAGSVGFTGDISGTMFIYIPENIAQELSAKMLDTEPEQLSPEALNDAIGELSNIAVGSVKNQLCEWGYNCDLTLPSILRGTHFEIGKQREHKLIHANYRFESLGEPLLVELLLNPSPQQRPALS